MVRHVSLLVALALSGCGGAAAPDAQDVDGGANAADGDDDTSGCPTRELFLEIGQGEEAFSPLGAGRSPRLFEGPQGLKHMAIALRVQSSASDNLESLEAHVVVTSWTPVDCAGGSNTEEGGCLFPVGERHVAFGEGELPLLQDDRGVTDAVGVYVALNWWPEAHERRIDAWIDTACDERPSARHIIPPSNRPF